MAILTLAAKERNNKDMIEAKITKDLLNRFLVKLKEENTKVKEKKSDVLH